MALTNSSIAEAFDRVADLLEIDGNNVFRIRAYRNAARVIENWPASLAEMIRKNEKLPKMPGLGFDLQGKVVELVSSGRLSVLEEMKKKFPGQIFELLTIPNVGPKRVRQLRDELKIDSIDKLKKAAEQHQLKKLHGFSDKLENKIISELQKRSNSPQRIKLSTAKRIADPLIEYLKASKAVKNCTVAGSYRRKTETVGDLDILLTTRTPNLVMNWFLAFEDIMKVLAHGTTRSTVKLANGLQVDVRVVPEEDYGAALHYFTGSKNHNIAIRTMGIKKGLKINEYGVFRGNKKIAGKTEQEIFQAVGLPFIEPELRENRGEIEAAKNKVLPCLISISDIRGDLHAHSKATDGRLSIEEMAAAASKRGYAYLAITDHSRHLSVARGLKPQDLLKQIKKIDSLNAADSRIRILKSIEVDILEDGSLDLPDHVLKELDFTVCSIHYKFNLSPEKQTARILKALENRYFSILGHPSGRLIGRREAYDLDFNLIMKAVAERGCFLELNSQPDRLDLTDVLCLQAKQMGIKIAISTDAHSDTELEFMEFGINQARRGWLEASDVLNTLPLQDLLRKLQRLRN